MDATTLAGSDKITGWWFNSKIGLALSNFSYDSGVAVDGVVILAGSALKPDGDGTFDILFPFATSGNTFDPGEKSVYLVSGVTASDFFLQSEPGGGEGSAGPYYNAVKLGNAFWAPTTTAAVPEPSTMLLLGSGLIGLAGYGRKKFFKK